MKTDNELIAEFMGWQKRPALFDTYWKKGEFDKTSNSFFYDDSWDQLMPVMEKIAKKYDETHLQVRPICELTIFARIDLVYESVVDFIKWYNSQSK